MRRKVTILAAGLLMGAMFFTTNVKAQEEESESPFSIGADLVSNYVWRGTKFAGPSIQPYVECAIGNLSIGSWGSFALGNDAPVENDFYISYSIGDLGLGLTDYYYQGPLFDFSDSLGSHAFEINLSYAIKGVSLSANYILNEAGGAASAGGDMYFELGYSFDNFDVFLGAGNGWHTTDAEFGLCNLGISTSKEIAIGEFSLPVSGSVIVNPKAEAAFLVVGFSF